MHKRTLSRDDDEPAKRRNLECHTIIDPQGDLDMELDDGTLRVSRKTLSLGSPVFLAMLGKNSKFMEATNRTMTEDGVQTISFPDDDFEAMTTIANIMHLKFDEVPALLPSEQLSHLALLCDKYDLKRCLGPYPSIWLKSMSESSVKFPSASFEEGLFTAAVFGYALLFKSLTRHFILETKTTEDGRLTTAKDGSPFGDRISHTLLGNSLL